MSSTFANQITPWYEVKTIDQHQAPVVQKVDSAIQWIVQLVSLILIHWIETYPVDSAIHLLNNWGQ